MNPRVAERLTRAARAAQALSEALWEGLHEELSDPRSQRVAELSELLADVSLAVASLARVAAGAPGEASATPVAPAVPVQPESPIASEPGIHDRPSSASVRASPMVHESPSAVLIDELAPEVQAEIQIRDERGEREQSQSAWIAAIGRRLERYERDGLPFAVLLVELADVERLRHAELPGEMARLTGLVETALAGELRPADSLTRESPGRYWLLAPETDAGGARTLVARLADAVRGAAEHRGTPLEVAVGVAVCPADGSRAAALAAYADVALYAARWESRGALRPGEPA